MNAVKQPAIAVLVSVRMDPTSGRATRSRADAAAVALAQQALGPAGEPWLCTAGDMPGAVASDYLAQGVGRLTRLRVGGAGGLDDVVAALEPGCRTRPLVLCGARGESGLATGMLPYALARRLVRPVIHDVIDLVHERDGGWLVVQALPRGARRSWRLDPGFCAVLVASARLPLREDLPQRYSWAAAQAGRIVDEPAMATNAPQAVQHSPWHFEPSRKLRRPLAAASNESGAARMARATGSAESARQGGVVIREGTALDKARLLLEHLRKLSLVDPAA